MIKKAMLWEKADGAALKCNLCAHRCLIDEDSFGFCGMRQNKRGELYTYAYGSVIANHVDPIEKKPLYHFLPGTYAYSIATIGCNFRCTFCQNWSISQLSARNQDMEGYEMKPEEVVREAKKNGCRSISYTYTEPTVFFEYAYDTAKIAKDSGISNSFVTNGYMTKEAVEKIRPYLDAANVDLKFFNDDSYQRICGASLKPVTETIENLKKAGVWVEVTTLIVPGENDSEEELRGIAGFISGIGKEIPWHVSRFHPDYKHTDSYPTPVETINRAREIGKEEGLKYIYLGNVPDTGKTLCPGCGRGLIERSGLSATIPEGALKDGKCSFCGAVLDGVWR
jgi:pyruvate formate lyase activating enzyme